MNHEDSKFLRADMEVDIQYEFTYEDYQKASNDGTFNFELAKFINQQLKENEIDATLLILNSWSAYKEQMSFVDLPDGLKEHLKGRIFSLTNRKNQGPVLNGRADQYKDERVLFEGLIDAFASSPEYVRKAKYIQVISFRHPMGPDSNIFAYVAKQFDKKFFMYAPTKHVTKHMSEDDIERF